MRPMIRLLLAGLLGSAPSIAGAQLAGNQMRAHFIDVGQADATLLEFACGAVLIDAGAQDSARADALLSYLNGVFSTRTDLNRTLGAVFITHNHIDHTRALMRLRDGGIRIERLLESGKYGSQNDQGDTPIEKLRAAEPTMTHVDLEDEDVVQTEVGLTSDDIDPVNCQTGTDPTIRVLSADLKENPGWPLKDFNDKNNHSLVIRVDFGMSSFLFTGDLEEDAIVTLLDFYAGTSLLDTDVYQAGHHGSINGTTTNLMKAIKKPRFAVISMGPCTEQKMWTAWKYGHPRKDAVDRIVKEVSGSRPQKTVTVATAVETFVPFTMKKAVYGTGWDGNVVLTATAGAQMTVTTSQAMAPPC